MRPTLRKHAPLVCLLAGLGLLSACDGERPIYVNNHLEVWNAADTFRFQIANMGLTTDTRTYVWRNSADSAKIIQSVAAHGGTATLTIKSPADVVLYQGSLRTLGTFPTLKGQTGDWRIHVALRRADGAINFRVERAP
jgi:hypothetical protein